MSVSKKISREVNLFYIINLVFICFFLIFAFIPISIGSGAYIFVFTVLIYGGWLGFILILISLMRIKSDYANLPSSYNMYVIGIVLIIINFCFFLIFTWVPISAFIFVTIYFILSLIGSFTCFFFLRKAKYIFMDNYEAFLEEKKVEQPQLPGRDYRICPVCNTNMAMTDQFCPQCGRKM